MEPNENNPLKPQPTGGLKLMTVFIAVLALHVLVIGGFSVWHLLYPANVDGDLALDKSHKTKIAGDSTIGDVTATDSTSSDKTAASAPAPADPSATSDGTAPADASTETTAATTATTPTPAPAAPAVANASAPTANSVITVPASPAMPDTPTMAEDTSAAAVSPAVTAQTPSGPVHQGPVVNPPDNLAPPVDSTASTTPAAVAPYAATPAVAVAGTPYVVKRGDSLAKIAHRHHLALAKLRAANSLASDSLHLGQKLVIPARAAKTAPDASEALASTPSNTSTTTAPPAAATYPVAQPVQESDGITTAPAPRSTLASALPRHTHKVAATSPHHLYTVVKGDTLTRIAKRYHTTTNAIMAVNSLPNAGRLSIGQKLHIPSHLSHEASTAQQGTMPESEPHSAAKGQLANYVQ